MIGTIATDRSYQFLRVITRVGHTESPHISGLKRRYRDEVEGDERERKREKKKVMQEEDERGIPPSYAYAVENQRGSPGGIYTAALIEFPVAIILLYTGRLAWLRRGKQADAVSGAINIRAKSYVAPGGRRVSCASLTKELRISERVSRSVYGSDEENPRSLEKAADLRNFRR